jgi:hydroxypyruvate isomerase
MPKFAANLSMMFTEVDFLDRFAAAAGAGFTGVEYLFPYAYAADDLKQRLADNGLAQALFNMPPGDWDAGERGIAALPGREAEFRDGVERAIEYARALDCPQVHAMAGLAPGGGTEKHLETYVENLRGAAKTCAGAGIRLLIEPINSRDMPGYFLDRPRQGLEVLEMAAVDNLYLQYDIYHAQIMEGSLAETIAANIGVIRHFQLAGVPGRHEPDVGEINYPYLFQTIDDLGYDGWIGCEYKPQGDTVAGLGWARDFGIG